MGAGIEGTTEDGPVSADTNSFDDLLIDVLVDEQPGSGDARLTGRGEDAGYGAGNRGGEIRVREDDVRGLAAEFEDRRNDVLRGRSRDLLRGLDPAGEADDPEPRVPGERRPGDSGPRHDVHDAGGYSHRLCQANEFECARRCVLGRLDDDRIACGKSGGKLVREKLER